MARADGASELGQGSRAVMGGSGLTRQVGMVCRRRGERDPREGRLVAADRLGLTG